MISDKNQAWLEEHIRDIAALKSPTEHQQMLVALAQITRRTPAEERRMTVLLKAEQSAVRAAAAREKARLLLRTEKKARTGEERRARDHALYQSAGLMIMAGLVDTKSGKPVMDTAALLGALTSLSQYPAEHPKWQEWKTKGSAILEKSGKK